nr:hypothetical protein [Tanacetum cinerariifolium]
MMKFCQLFYTRTLARWPYGRSHGGNRVPLPMLLTVLGRAGYDPENEEVKSGDDDTYVVRSFQVKPPPILTVLGRAGYDPENEEVKSGFLEIAIVAVVGRGYNRLRGVIWGCLVAAEVGKECCRFGGKPQRKMYSVCVLSCTDSIITSLPVLLIAIGLAVGPTSLPVEMTVAGGPSVGMKPLPVGTSIPPASTVAASMEVKTLAISSESLLILSAAASPSLILLSLIRASSPDSQNIALQAGKRKPRKGQKSDQNQTKTGSQEEKQIEEEQADNARYWKIPACFDDDDDYNFAMTPNEPVDSLTMGDEHLDIVPATKSDEFIKSSVENLVPNPSESEGDNECDEDLHNLYNKDIVVENMAEFG